MNKMHETNRRRWNAASAKWALGADSRGIWQRCARKPELALHARERHWLGAVRGRRVAVLGSGDNQVVFALAGLGARVTSVDISERQLDVARGRAAELGLDVSFLRADVTDLSALVEDSFDLVFTGGHVAVWVSNLKRFYAEAARILKPGGRLLVSEYHPFRRLWKDDRRRLRRQFDYFDRGPHVFDCMEGLFDRRPKGPYRAYEFHWTVAEYIGAVLAAGCTVEAVEEFGDASEGWEVAPLAGLPQVLLIAARKG